MTRTWRLLLAGVLIGYGAASYARLEQLGPGWARAGVAALVVAAGLIIGWYNGADDVEPRR